MRTPLKPTSVGEVLEIAQQAGMPNKILVQLASISREKMFRAIGLKDDGNPTAFSLSLAKHVRNPESIFKPVEIAYIAWNASEKVNDEIPAPAVRYPYNSRADLVSACSVISEHVTEIADVDAAGLCDHVWIPMSASAQWRKYRALYDRDMLNDEQEKAYSGILDDAESALKERMADPQYQFLHRYIDGIRNLYDAIDFLTMSKWQRQELLRKN